MTNGIVSGTRTTVGTAVIAIVFLLGGVWRVERGFSNLESVQRDTAAIQARAQAEDRVAQEKAQIQSRYEFEKIDLRLKSIEGATGDRWTRADMRAWIREYRANPSGPPPPVD